MKTIAFDVMGNDNGVRAGVEAALAFSSTNLNYKFVLVGDEEQIKKFTKETERIEIVHSPNVIDVTKGARAARTGDNSMSIAIKMVADGYVDAVVSSGDSGVYLAMTTLILKRIKGVKRPAFMPIVPTIFKGKKFLLMDVGANLETTSEMLVQWAKMGAAFAKAGLKINSPKVGVVNIGTEDKKGMDIHKEANEILKAEKDIKYSGFIESRELLNGIVDVAVVDGYAGNMILKTLEGTVLSLLSLIKTKLSSKTKYKIGALLAKGAFNDVKNVLDYRNVGSAFIIGVNGLAIKAHGGSDKQSYIGAFGQLALALENNVLSEFKKEFGE